MWWKSAGWLVSGSSGVITVTFGGATGAVVSTTTSVKHWRMGFPTKATTSGSYRLVVTSTAK